MIEGLDGESGSSSRVWVARRHRSGRLQEVERLRRGGSNRHGVARVYERLNRKESARIGCESPSPGPSLRSAFRLLY